MNITYSILQEYQRHVPVQNLRVSIPQSKTKYSTRTLRKDAKVFFIQTIYIIVKDLMLNKK